MASLYEIDNAILSCIDQETGEIIDTERLAALQMERDAKIENIALWYKNLCSDAEAYKAEKQAFEAKQKAAEAKAESLKKYLEYALGGSPFKTTKVEVSYRKSEAVECKDEGAFIAWAMTQPDCEEYLNCSLPKVNKANIKKLLKGGTTIEGVELLKKQNIQIK